MSILGFLGLGKQAGDAIASPLNAVGNTLDKLFTSDEERAQADAVMEKIRQQPQILQTEINKLEAQHRSIFVAGWRPFIGWVCGFAMLWKYMLSDIAIWITVTWYPSVKVPELGGTQELITILLALLGMAGYRTIEKAKKLSK